MAGTLVSTGRSRTPADRGNGSGLPTGLTNAVERGEATPAAQLTMWQRAKGLGFGQRVMLALSAFIVLGLAFVIAERFFLIRPSATQRVVVSRHGEVTAVYGPGQTGFINPWSQTRTVFDTAIAVADRSGAERVMTAITSEGHPVRLFGAAFWQEGDEADLRWRFSHIRRQAEAMSPLMAAAVQAVIGRFSMDDLIRRNAEVQAALTEDLKVRARALLRVSVTAFLVTGVEPGESFRQLVTERELDRVRAASIAASPALTGTNPNAVELERIRRWDGRGITPDLSMPMRAPGSR